MNVYRRMLYEALLVLRYTGHFLWIVNRPKDPGIVAALAPGGQNRRLRIVMYDPPDRHDFLLHECLHFNFLRLKKSRRWSNHILDEAVQYAEQFEFARDIKSGYRAEEWPEEAFVRLAVDWHKTPRKERSYFQVSQDLRRALSVSTNPDYSGLAFYAVVVFFSTWGFLAAFLDLKIF